MMWNKVVSEKEQLKEDDIDVPRNYKEKIDSLNKQTYGEARHTAYVGISNGKDVFHIDKNRNLIQINLTPPLKQTVDVSVSKNSISVGKTASITVSKAKGKISYKSSNTNVAAVSSDGIIKAKKVGTVKISVTAAAEGLYRYASKDITIKVVPAATASVTAVNQPTGIKITWKKVAGATGYKIYRGSSLVKKIASGSTVTFTDTKANTNGGKYTFKVVAYAGTGTSNLYKSVATYRVARPAISSLTSPKTKQMLVKWGKNAKATGYQIQYSTSSTFAAGNKTVTFKGAATVSKTIRNLRAKKRYYVRIRSYKTVSGKNYYSAWSAVKKLTTK